MSNETITVLGYVVGNVDSVASVAEAKKNLAADPANSGAQAAYNAAYYNALAAQSAPVPGVGAVFASKAITADLVDISQNGYAKEKMTTLFNNIVGMAANGVSLIPAAYVADVAIGAATFKLSELLEFANASLTGAGVILDASTIQNYLEESIQSLGLVKNAEGSYPVTAPSNQTLSIDKEGNTTLNTYSDEKVLLNSATNTYASNGVTDTSFTTYQNGKELNQIYSSQELDGSVRIDCKGTGAICKAEAAEIYLDNNANVTVEGIGNTITLGDGGAVSIDGINQTIYANNDTITLGTDDTATIIGNNNTINGDSKNTVNIQGTGNTSNMTDSVINYTGDNTGNVVNGDGNSGDNWADTTPAPDPAPTPDPVDPPQPDPAPTPDPVDPPQPDPAPTPDPVDPTPDPAPQPDPVAPDFGGGDFGSAFACKGATLQSVRQLLQTISQSPHPAGAAYSKEAQTSIAPAPILTTAHH